MEVRVAYKFLEHQPHVRILPDAVSSSENPLLRDESASTGVSPHTGAVVLQGNLKYTQGGPLSAFCSSRSWFYRCTHDCLSTVKVMQLSNCLHLLLISLLPARASCEAWHPLLQPPWSPQGGRWARRTRRLRRRTQTGCLKAHASVKSVMKEIENNFEEQVKHPYQQQQRVWAAQISSCLYLHSLQQHPGAYIYLSRCYATWKIVTKFLEMSPLSDLTTGVEHSSPPANQKWTGILGQGRYCVCWTSRWNEGLRGFYHREVDFTHFIQNVALFFNFLYGNCVSSRWWFYEDQMFPLIVLR